VEGRTNLASAIIAHLTLPLFRGKAPFTSKFDAVMAGKAQFTPQEQAGYAAM